MGILLFPNIFEVFVPDVKFFTHPPSLYVRAPVKPGRDFLNPGIGIIRAAAKFNNHVEPVITAAASTVAPSRFNGLYDEVVKKLIKSILLIPGDKELPSPFSEFAIMFFLAESFFHLSIFSNDGVLLAAFDGFMSLYYGTSALIMRRPEDLRPISGPRRPVRLQFWVASKDDVDQANDVLLFHRTANVWPIPSY